MNPEDTDKYRRFEDLLFRLTHAKKNAGETDEPNASKADQQDPPKDEPPRDPQSR